MWKGSLRSNIGSVIRREAYSCSICVSARSAASWSPAANSTKPSIDSSRSTKCRGTLCSSSLIRDTSVERARSTLPRCASIKERQPNATAWGNPISNSSTMAQLRSGVLVGQIPASGTELDQSKPGQAIGSQVFAAAVA